MSAEATRVPDRSWPDFHAENVATVVSLSSLVGLATGEILAVKHFQLEDYVGTATLEETLTSFAIIAATFFVAHKAGILAGNVVSPGFYARMKERREISRRLYPDPGQ